MSDITHTTWAASLAQLAASRSVEATRRKFNPRPPGSIQAGSATETVLAILREQPARYFTAGDLMACTGRSHPAVSWAPLYLQREGLIRAVGDSRNERWLRYTASAEATNSHGSARRA